MKSSIVGNFVATVGVVAASASCLAQTNSWVGTATGAWEDLTWSLGVRPSASQSAIMITNYGQKAVIIGANTVNNFPGTLSISNLTLGGTALSTNTLLLNFTGTAHPLQIKDTLNVLSNSVMLNLNGMVRLDGTNPVTVVDGVMNQDGGSNVFPGEIAFGVHSPGYYNLTNGTLICGQTYVGELIGPSYYDGAINQFGGIAQFQRLELGGNYTMSNGSCEAGSISIGDVGTGIFSQAGGDVAVTNGISIGSGVAGNSSGGGWTMQNGTLTAAGISLGIGNGRFSQVNGTVRVGSIDISGYDSGYDYPTEGFYSLQGGQLLTGSLSINGPYGEGFTQTGGMLSVSGQISGAISQTGGILHCSNAFYNFAYVEPYGNGPVFEFSNATNVVTNNLFVGSYNDLTFNLRSGLLQCGSLDLGVCMFNITGGQFVAPGPVKLEGAHFSCGVTNQDFGPLTLSDDSSIQFATNPCVIRFADSSAVPWQSYATLSISGWQGSTNGGGATRIYIGNSGHGLTSAQLSQIRFNDSQFARQLATGEIVPTDQPTMNISVVETNLVISWPTTVSSSFHLQSATNVTGPYVDVTNAPDPYTIGTGLGQQFFRLH